MCLGYTRTCLCVLKWKFIFLQGVQLVDSLVFMCPLQVQLDFLHQRNTVSLSDVQFFWLADAILLHGMEQEKKKSFIHCLQTHIATVNILGRDQENTSH